MDEGKLVLNQSDEVVVRMYGQGFGDCFLLAFPRLKDQQNEDLQNPVYVVIDSGVFFLTPGDKERMRSVAESIRHATGGKIDLLIATHEHHDHLCGFEYAVDVWKKIQVHQIWLAWTEDEKHPAAQKYDKEKQALQSQTELALEIAQDYSREDPALEWVLRRVQTLTAFAGPDDEDGQLPKPKGKIRPAKRISKLPDRVLDDFAKAPGIRFEPNIKTERKFCEPGHVRSVPKTNVDAYVLGPPMTEGRLAQDSITSELYPKEESDEKSDNADTNLQSLAKHLELAAASDRAERESIFAALQRHRLLANDSDSFDDSGAPFRNSMSLPYAMAEKRRFFQDHYFNKGKSSRKIETEWLHGFGRLALQIDKVVNNTSLVLAFRLPDERVLLFVGDAQVGNWLSWHEIEPKDWKRPDGGPVHYRPTAGELLAATAVYKVGHHGSHNATLKARGLELMPDGLIAFVPTSRVFPQDLESNQWTIPLPSLTEALWRKTGGRVIFPHEHPDYSYFNSQFNERVEVANDKFDPMVQKNKVIEDAVPIWRQVRI